MSIQSNSRHRRARPRRLPCARRLVVVALGLLVLVAGCSGDSGSGTASSGPAPSGTGPTDRGIAIMTPEVAKDYGWNQQGVTAARTIADEAGIPLTVQDGAGYEDVGPLLRELADPGPRLLIAFASGYGTTAPQVAQETGVPVITIGQFEKGNIPGLSQDIETHAEHGAYLAGIVAARTTRTGTLGIVMSADDENWVKMAGGFVQGARAAKPESRILLAQVGQAGYSDAAGGRRVAASVIAGGADVVFGMGDGSSFGMIQAVETSPPPPGADKLWFIDVIGDKSSLDKKGVYLSSVVWDYAPAFRRALAALDDGSFGRKTSWLDLADGGIGLLRTPHIPDAVWAEVEQAKEAIRSGTVTVRETTSKAQVEELIRN